MQVYSDELYHFGIKGMKWGVIKNPITSIKNTITKSILKDRKRDKAIKKARSNVVKYKKQYDNLREKYMNSNSLKVQREYEKVRKIYLNTLDFSREKTRKEKGQKIIGDFLGAVGSLSAVALLGIAAAKSK